MNNKVGINFETDVTKKGVFRSLIGFMNFECGETSIGDCKNVFNDETGSNESNYWYSTNSPDSYYTLKLTKGYVYVSDGALYSCNRAGCISNFTIYGVEKGDSEEKEICHYSNEDKEYFLGKLKSFPCQYEKPLK